MKTILSIVLEVAFVLCLCHASHAQSTPDQAASPAQAAAPSILPVFGNPGGKAIRVSMLGQINRSGTYYLPSDTKLKDAIAKAGGVNRLSMWKYSYVERTVDAEHKEKIRFRSAKKTEDLEMPLKDGDRVFISEILD